MKKGTLGGIKASVTCPSGKEEEAMGRDWPSDMACYLPWPQLTK